MSTENTCTEILESVKYIQCNALYEDESPLLFLKNELSNSHIQDASIDHILQKCEQDLQE